MAVGVAVIALSGSEGEGVLGPLEEVTVVKDEWDPACEPLESVEPNGGDANPDE